MLKIPIQNLLSNSSQEITLEDTPYRLDFLYNSRGDYWTFSILDRNRNPIVTSIRLVPEYPLIDEYPYTELPPGDFIVIDTTEKEESITRDNLGFDEDGNELPFQLLYITQAETESLLAE